MPASTTTTKVSPGKAGGKKRRNKSLGPAGKKSRRAGGGTTVKVPTKAAPKILKTTAPVPVEPKELDECPRVHGVALPALFDRTFVARATKDELLTTMTGVGLLGNVKSRKRTVTNMRSILAEQREELVKKIPLDKPVVLLKNAGKHSFYRVSVDRVKKGYQLKVEWGATGMKKVSKFDEEKNMFLTLAPKKQEKITLYKTREEAESAARKLIQSKDDAPGYYLSFADSLVGMDAKTSDAKIKERTLRFEKAFVQPFDNNKKVKDVLKEEILDQDVKSRDGQYYRRKGRK